MDISDFIAHYWWWIIVLLYGWVKYIQKEQKKRAAQLEADKKRMSAVRKAVEENSNWIPSDSAEQPQQDEEYDAKIFSFESPVAEEENEDEKARAAAFQFVPAEKEGETAQATEKEYAFKPEGYFPAFVAPQEDVRAGEYFPQGIMPQGKPYLSAEEIRRSIITMEILLPPRCKRPRR
jgi:hypothetical protein